MTAKDMLPAIGSRALVRFESILVECIISDAKFAYGNARVLVSPVSGQGQQWVEFSRLVSAVPASSQSEHTNYIHLLSGSDHITVTRETGYGDSNGAIILSVETQAGTVLTTNRIDL